jgi:hypothetical protein
VSMCSSPSYWRWLPVALLLTALCAAPVAAAGPYPPDGPIGAGPYQAPAAPPNVATVSWDLLVLRPLGLVQVATGVGFFVVFYPIALVTGGSDHVLDSCILQPAEQTFTRRLGAL